MPLVTAGSHPTGRPAIGIPHPGQRHGKAFHLQEAQMPQGLVCRFNDAPETTHAQAMERVDAAIAARLRQSVGRR